MVRLSLLSLELLSAEEVLEHRGYGIGGKGAHYGGWLWGYTALIDLPNCCNRCKEYHRRYSDGRLTGNVIPRLFPYHEHTGSYTIDPNIHPHCRCKIVFVGGRI